MLVHLPRMDDKKRQRVSCVFHGDCAELKRVAPHVEHMSNGQLSIGGALVGAFFLLLRRLADIAPVRVGSLESQVWGLVQQIQSSSNLLLGNAPLPAGVHPDINPAKVSVASKSGVSFVLIWLNWLCCDTQTLFMASFALSAVALSAQCNNWAAVQTRHRAALRRAKDHDALRSRALCSQCHGDEGEHGMMDQSAVGAAAAAAAAAAMDSKRANDMMMHDGGLSPKRPNVHDGLG